MRDARGTYRFGPFRLDADARKLFRGEERVYLQDRSFDVLALFVANPGEILSQDDLTKAVWTDYDVTDNSIVQTVGVLRDLLAGRTPEPDPKQEPGGGKPERGRRKRQSAGRNGKAARPRRKTAPRKKDMSCIQTMHRKGYRFILKVEHEPKVEREDPKVEHAEPAAPRVWRGNRQNGKALLERHSIVWDSRAAIETLELAAVEQAFDVLTGLVRVYPDMPELHIGIANAGWLRHESTRAFPRPDWDVLAVADRHAQEAYRLKPSSGHALSTLAINYFSRGKWREAIAAAREAVALQPEEWRHFLRLAHVSWGADRLSAAYEVLSMHPCMALAHWYAATVFIARGAFDRAREHLDAACAAQAAQRKEGAPFTAIGSRLVNGLRLYACGSPAEAREEIRRELALDARQVYSRESHANGWCALGAFDLRESRGDEACEAFRQARCLIPGHALAEIGLACQASGVDVQSLGLGPSALAQNAEHAVNTVNLAIVHAVWLALRARHEEAARLCYEALIQAPPGFSGWILPIEPLLHVSARKNVWAQTLAVLRDRAS